MNARQRHRQWNEHSDDGKKNPSTENVVGAREEKKRSAQEIRVN